MSALTVKINSPDKENTLLCREFKAHYATNNGRDHSVQSGFLRIPDNC